MNIFFFSFFTESDRFYNPEQIHRINQLGSSRLLPVFTRNFHTSAINSSQDDPTQGNNKNHTTKKKPETVNDPNEVKMELYADDKEEFKYWEADRRTRAYHDTEQTSESAYINIVQDQLEQELNDLNTDTSIAKESEKEFKYSEADGRTRAYHDTEQTRESSYINIIQDQVKQGMKDFSTNSSFAEDGAEEFKYSEADGRTSVYHDTEQMSESAYINIVQGQLKQGMKDFSTDSSVAEDGAEEFKYSEADGRTSVYHDTEQMSESSYITIVQGQLNEGVKDFNTESSVLDDQKIVSLSDTLTHTDISGKLNMVDIGAKLDTDRIAVAMATIKLGEKAYDLVKNNKSKKGDVLTVAQIAGITAAKQTSTIIPLCHNIPLSNVKVDLELVQESWSVVITSLAKTYGKTGVEMEAIMAATVAAVTVYDMCKAVSRDMVISDIKLVKKTGGIRGDYQIATK